MSPPLPGWDRVKKIYQLNRRRGALAKDKVSGRRKYLIVTIICGYYILRIFAIWKKSQN